MTFIARLTTQILLNATRANLPQSLLLSGPAGVGLLFAAHQLASSNATVVLHPKNTKGERDDTTGTISIEAIRDLYEQTRTKLRTERIIIIDNAERMSHGAQSAFLKLLEEPNAATHFILTSHHPDTLPPTIRSRAQTLRIQPVTIEQSKEFIKNLDIRDSTKQTQLLFLASGLPAELTRLTENQAYFESLAGIISDARTFITADAYQKMRLIHKYRSQREHALRFIDGVITILRFTLETHSQLKLVVQLDKLLEARERIAANQSVALQLARVVL